MGLALPDLGLGATDLGLAERDLGLAERDLGLAERDLGVAERDLGLAERDLGLAERDLALPDPERELLDPLLDRSVSLGLPAACFPEGLDDPDLLLLAEPDRFDLLDLAGELDLLREAFEAFDDFLDRAERFDFGDSLPDFAGLPDLKAFIHSTVMMLHHSY